MRKPMAPRLTDKIIDGIIFATSHVLAGIGEGGECDQDEDAIIAADKWARSMRDYRAKATK